MSVLGGRTGAVTGGSLCSEVQSEQVRTFQGMWESLYSELQCIMGNGRMGLPSRPVDRQARVKTLLSGHEVAGGNKMSALQFIYIFEIIGYA